MRQLMRHYRKQSQRFWLGTAVVVICLYLFLLYQLLIVGLVINDVATVLSLILVLFLFATGFKELKRTIDTYVDTHFRLLPISEIKLYFSNLLFSWSTIMLQVLFYSLGLSTLFLGQANVKWLDYVSFMSSSAYFLFSSFVYLGLIYLISRALMNYCPVKYQKIVMPSLLLLFFILQNLIYSGATTFIRKFDFPGGFNITLFSHTEQMDWSDLLLDGIFALISIGLSIYLLKHYVEPERR